MTDVRRTLHPKIAQTAGARPFLDKFYVVSPAVPNGAGDHRAPRTPPWRGAVRLRAPYVKPPTHNGLYGRVLLYDIPTPPPPDTSNPPYP